MYYCNKCKSKHQISSNKGKEHRKYSNETTSKKPGYAKKTTGIKEVKILSWEYGNPVGVKLHIGNQWIAGTIIDEIRPFENGKKGEMHYKIGTHRGIMYYPRKKVKGWNRYR